MYWYAGLSWCGDACGTWGTGEGDALAAIIWGAVAVDPCPAAGARHRELAAEPPAGALDVRSFRDALRQLAVTDAEMLGPQDGS